MMHTFTADHDFMFQSAEFWSALHDLIESLKPKALRPIAPVLALASSQSRPPHSSPSLRIDGFRLFCGDVSIGLAKRPQMIKLFRALLNAPDNKITKSELLRILYTETPARPRSKRFNDSLNQNVIKLVSRARHLCERHFRRTEPELDWMCYVVEEGVWYLWRPKSDHHE